MPDDVLPARVAGPDGAPVTLVLLHAFPLDGRMWEPQIEALAPRWRLAVPDLRGFGAARDRAGAVTTMDLLAEDTARLLDAHRLPQAVLAGCSMGGYAAMRFACRYPDRLAGLLLVSTRGGADTEQAAKARLDMAQRVLREGVGSVPDAMLPRLLGSTSLRTRPDLVALVRQLILEQDPRGVAAAQRGMAVRPDSFADLAGVRVPTLIVAGTEDQLTGPPEARALAEAIPGAAVTEIPGAGHLPNLEQPGAFNQAVEGFLRQFP